METHASRLVMDEERIELPDTDDEQHHREWAGGVGESVGLGMRLVVSPTPGRLRLLPAIRFHEGEEWVSAGQPIAEVENGPEVSRIVATHEARVAGILVRDGEPVLQGQPLVWLDETARKPDE